MFCEELKWFNDCMKTCAARWDADRNVHKLSYTVKCPQNAVEMILKNLYCKKIKCLPKILGKTIPVQLIFQDC